MTVLVLSTGRQLSVRHSAKQIREWLCDPGYVKVGSAMFGREQVMLICVENEVVEEAKRRLISPRLGIRRARSKVD